MNSRDLIMVLSSLLSMAAGVFLPQAAEPLAAMPRLILIFMLYMSFLAVGMEALMREIRHMKGTLCFLVALRLAVLPLLCLAVFRLLMPQFALGAFLLGAAPSRKAPNANWGMHRRKTARHSSGSTASRRATRKQRVPFMWRISRIRASMPTARKLI